MSFELTFGKHKTKTIQEVHATDPSYCRWLLNQQILLESNPDIAEFLKINYHNDDGSFLMTWDRYKNKTIKQIKALDSNYIEWLKKNEFVREKMPKLLTALNEL